MAERPAFFPKFDTIGVETRSFAFTWSPGLAPSQKRKNVVALHEAITESRRGCRPLEISRRSLDDAGVRMSAFNLMLPLDGAQCSVESVFQASKVFEFSGPHPEQYPNPPRDVRAFVKENARGLLTAFDLNGTRWPLRPTTAFYDWLYLKALAANPDLAEALLSFGCFTDIEFNPEKSLNCQAYAAALYRSLAHAGKLDEALSNQEAFLRYHPKN